MNTVPLMIANDGTSPCYLLGYPTIAMYDSNGTVLAFVYTHTGDMVVTARPPSRVDLTPGVQCVRHHQQVPMRPRPRTARDLARPDRSG